MAAKQVAGVVWNSANRHAAAFIDTLVAAVAEPSVGRVKKA